MDAMAAPVFPFTAVVGQDDLRHALTLCAVDPAVGGVLALGDRGTGKSTTVRGLAQLLTREGLDMPVVDLPLGASEDRVLGSLDIDRALRGEIAYAPGLLAAAHGGILYIDEVNLLDDYLVDLLLDVAASGVNTVERDGLSHTHPARFVLVGSGNPEEGELRPQLEDRFGLSTPVATIRDLEQRWEIVRRRLAFERDPGAFTLEWAEREERLAARIRLARERCATVDLGDEVLEAAVRICVDTRAVGHRAELVLVRAARAAAALAGRPAVTVHDLAAVAVPALQHRAPRTALEPVTAAAARVRVAAASVLGRRVA
ncbi:magnesium chelatase subunit I [Microbacterium trichothecenolyticum]|uniref:Magnesium chelatase subunit I n=2 Tax=Microbacterium trichothecenolyticum TaxID=69370 RepID=A0ABU0TTD7_MICTR|nr:magnesium chelatase subunit I [Microbacterium trichothecenolyticum]